MATTDSSNKLMDNLPVAGSASDFVDDVPFDLYNSLFANAASPDLGSTGNPASSGMTATGNAVSPDAPNAIAGIQQAETGNSSNSPDVGGMASTSPDLPGAAATSTDLSSPDEPITGSGMLGTARGGGIYPSAKSGGSTSTISTSTGSTSTSGGSSTGDASMSGIFDSMQAPSSDALATDSAAQPTSAWDGLGGAANSGHAMFEPMPQNNVIDWSADTNAIAAQLFPDY